MNAKEVDLFFVSSMLGRAIEDLIYKQIEEKQRHGDIGPEAAAWLSEVSSLTNDNKKQKSRIINYDTINQDITVFISLKEQIDKILGITEEESETK